MNALSIGNLLLHANISNFTTDHSEYTLFYYIIDINYT